MNFIKLSLASLLFIGATSIVSCKKDDDKKTTPTESCTNNGYLTFLKVGNKLTYDYVDWGSDDTILVMEITGTTSDGSYQYDLSGGGTFTGAYKNRYIKECNDWMLVNTVEGNTFANNKSYPAIRKAGDTWVIGTSNNYSVVATGVSLSTPAGVFVCDKIAYHQTGSFNTDTIYYSNDIGWVKYEGFLLEYELKSKNF